MSDASNLAKNIRDRFSGTTEERLGKALSDLLENPLLTGAIGRAFDAREKATQAQEVAFGALNIPSAADIERLTRGCARSPIVWRGSRTAFSVSIVPSPRRAAPSRRSISGCRRSRSGSARFGEALSGHCRRRRHRRRRDKAARGGRPLRWAPSPPSRQAPRRQSSGRQVVLRRQACSGSRAKSGRGRGQVASAAEGIGPRETQAQAA